MIRLAANDNVISTDTGSIDLRLEHPNGHPHPGLSANVSSNSGHVRLISSIISGAKITASSVDGAIVASFLPELNAHVHLASESGSIAFPQEMSIDFDYKCGNSRVVDGRLGAGQNPVSLSMTSCDGSIILQTDTQGLDKFSNVHDQLQSHFVIDA